MTGRPESISPGWIRRLEACVRHACLLEAAARKPGNVHPEASFADLRHEDFVRSAEIVAPVLARTAELGVGPAVLEAVRLTRAAVGRNTNLGIVLLLAPLAAVPEGTPLTEGIGDVLNRLTRHDAALVYEAIRIAQPGGLGRVARDDVSAEPTGTLLDAMRLAADRDAVAAQYATGYADVLGFGLPWLGGVDEFPARWEGAIVELHLRLMVRRPDTLIARKRGGDEARDAARRAGEALDAGGPSSEEGRRRMRALDDWLRAEGNGRNPGATADLVAACLFAALRERRIVWPPESR